MLGDPDAHDEALVLVETVTRGLTIRSTDEIRQYIEHFTALRASAVDGLDTGVVVTCLARMSAVVPSWASTVTAIQCTAACSLTP
ncbi:MAG: hypothetical protein ACRDTC_00270 [Pseudonocardiaceae bacterium]